MRKNINNNFLQDKILPRNLLITYDKKFNPVYSHYPLVKKKVSNNVFNLLEKGNIKNSRKIALDKIKLKKSKNYVLKIFMKKNPQQRYFVNINPRNKKSIKFFTKNGFKILQHTYKLEID